MTESPARGASTSVSRHIQAPPGAVYRAFLDRDALEAWLPPDTMRGQVHTFDPREGGRFQMSLTYEQPERSPGGKTTADTDTVQVRFVELIPYEKIVEIAEFESEDPEFAGEMRMIITFKESGAGTDVTYLCEDIPKGIRPEDNEEGTRQSLRNLAAFLE